MTREDEGKPQQESQLVPWRWPLTLGALGALAWFAYEVVMRSSHGDGMKQSFGLMLILGVPAALAWAMSQRSRPGS